ncbi:unnamed protein product [Pleuronectes platessa]|uniref:Uncharacterized protein n=1 Tax=Pleuronectes platessa TaxID=8262 RepID=A0A9N7UCI9_PLEPL|nr:unnamed protein product [Pleuronectes platessa]
MGLESACDNGERGDLANRPQLMSSSTHLSPPPPPVPSGEDVWMEQQAITFLVDPPQVNVPVREVKHLQGTTQSASRFPGEGVMGAFDWHQVICSPLTQGDLLGSGSAGTDSAAVETGGAQAGEEEMDDSQVIRLSHPLPHLPPPPLPPLREEAWAAAVSLRPEISLSPTGLAHLLSSVCPPYQLAGAVRWC